MGEKLLFKSMDVILPHPTLECYMNVKKRFQQDGKEMVEYIPCDKTGSRKDCYGGHRRMR
jgi:hypothetical protein